MSTVLPDNNEAAQTNGSTYASDEEIAQAARILESGGLAAFPTETVYGLGADAANPQAIELLYKTKGRPADHPSIVHLYSIEQLPLWASRIPDDALRLAERFWPGPMTLILPKRPEVSAAVTGGQNSVGIRLPSHPVAIKLLKTFGRGIAAPSANRFGRISPTTAQHVKDDFGADVPVVLEGGPCQVGVESTIIDFASNESEPKILRPGMLTAEIISDYLNKPINFGVGAKAPGTLKKHYSPRTSSFLVPSSELTAACQDKNCAILSWHACPIPNNSSSEKQGHWIIMPDNPEDYARRIYSWLRYLDSKQLSAIYIEQLPDSPEWAAVRDRLTRATAR